jgi:hypothetical protein
MKSLLVTLSTRRAIGIQIGDRAIVTSQVAQTPLGPIEIARHSEPMGEECLEVVLPRALAPILSAASWRAAPIAIGLPVLRVFFSTRPIKTMDRDASPQVLLHEVLQSSNLLIDDMDIDMIRGQPFKQPVASIIATRKKYLATIAQAMEGSEVRPHIVEPAPFALLRAGLLRHRTPRGVKSTVRVFLGESHAISLLTALDLPLAWRYHELPPNGEAAAIASAVTTLRSLSKFYGVDAPPDVVIVHGRSDLVGLQDSPDWLKEPVRTRRHDGPALDDANVAFGLALGLLQEGETFNLVRESRPKGSLPSLIPWKQIVAQAGVLVVATMLMHANADTLETQLALVKKQQKKFAWLAKKTPSVLEKERVELKASAAAMQHYFETRAHWTGFVCEFAELLPDAMTFSSVKGQGEYYDPKSKPPENARAVTVKLETPIGEGGAMPAEVDNIVDALRESSVIRKDFPVIKLAELRFSPSQRGKREFASFSVICTPNPKVVGAGTKPPRAK